MAHGVYSVVHHVCLSFIVLQCNKLEFKLQLETMFKSIGLLVVAEKKVECGEIFHTAADKSRCLVENKVLYYLITEYRGSSYKFYTLSLYLRQGGHVIVVVCLYVCVTVSNFAQKRLNGFT